MIESAKKYIPQPFDKIWGLQGKYNNVWMIEYLDNNGVIFLIYAKVLFVLYKRMYWTKH